MGPVLKANSSAPPVSKLALCFIFSTRMKIDSRSVVALLLLVPFLAGKLMMFILYLYAKNNAKKATLQLLVRFLS